MPNPVASDARDVFSAAVNDGLARSARLLPAQAPLSVFVALNTLQAFQHLHFHDAVLQAKHVLDAEPYLAEEAFRNHLQRGRITREDLEAALLDQLPAEAQPDLIDGVLSVATIRLTMLRYAIQHETDATLAWLIQEQDVTRRDSALWDACRELGRGYASATRERATRLRTHRDVLLESTGDDAYDRVFPVLIRLSAAYLDDGLASWSMPSREHGFYNAVRRLVAEGSALPMRWRKAAQRDFRNQLKRNLTAMECVMDVLESFGVEPHAIADYVETILLTLPGWAGMMSRLEHNPTDLMECPPALLLDFLAVRLTYERAALRDIAEEHHGPQVSLRDVWYQAPSLKPPARQPHARAETDPAYRLFQLMQLVGVPLPIVRSLTRPTAHAILAVMDSFDGLWRRRVFQEAFERHYRVETLDALHAHRKQISVELPSERPRLQVITCFDDREESFRRHLEEVEPRCQTFGAPGFFGAAIRFRAIGQPHHVPLAPVVINPSHHVDERPRLSDAAIHERRQKRLRYWAEVRAQTRAGSRSLWRGTLLNVVFGLLAVFPLLVRIASPRNAGRLQRFTARALFGTPRTQLTVHHEDASDGPARGFHVDERVSRVATVLENTGLKRCMSKLVLVLGHGATTLNNPHASAYDCGACGGRQGGPNARVFADMANDPEVRAGLRALGIDIPADTYFVGGQHDTCNEDVSFFDLENMPASHRELFAEATRLLGEARARDAQERCRRMEPFSAPRDPSPIAALHHVEARAEHLAEPRPELSHQANAVAIIGRRSITRGLFLDRRAFVLSYDPTIDPEGKILERTLAAAAPVGAGINLQYYFSAVDNERYGSGSKLPHNIVGLIGVMTGHASDLRTGLPRQMIDAHEAQRLLLVVEATPERLLAIAERQAEIKELIVNRWVQLVSIDPDSGALHVFTDRGFEPYRANHVQLPTASRSHAFYRGKVGPLPPAEIVTVQPAA